MFKRKSQFTIPLIFMTFLLFLGGCGPTQKVVTPKTENNNPPINGLLQVHFLNVGQADSILVIAPNGQTMLVDGGNIEDGPEEVEYLKSQGVKKLFAVVATHPHEDHLGGLETIMQSFPPTQVYMSNGLSTTRTFEDFMTAVKKSGAEIIRAKAGVKLNVQGLSGIFLAPNSNQYEDLNNYSAVLKISFGKVSFLLTGDAEDISEAEMLKSGQDLNAAVLKVGHHGSASSTTGTFLAAVSPQYAIISVGKDNDYGHPAPATLDKLTKAGVQVYRTDQDGTIVATTDGETVSLTPSLPSTSLKPVHQVSETSPGTLIISKLDLKSEEVWLLNTGDKAVDLTGWKLVSEIGNQIYMFPAGTTILAGQPLVVMSGQNAHTQPGAQTLLWTETNIWNNDGDPGALYDAQGHLVSRK